MAQVETPIATERGGTHSDGDGSTHSDDGSTHGDSDGDGGDGTHSDGDQGEHNTHAPLEYYEYKVLDSSSYGMANDDGVINPGERIYLGVCIHNTTDKAISSVRVTLKTQSPYIDFRSDYDSLYYNKIEANNYDTACKGVTAIKNIDYSSSYAFSFDVSKSCPYTSIPMTLTIKDGEGNSYESTFNIKVEESKVDLEYYAYYAFDSSYSTNNGDRKINPGETVYLDIAIHNKGNATARGVRVSISCESPYITLTDSYNNINYGKLEGGYYKEYYDYDEDCVKNPDDITYHDCSMFRTVVAKNCPFGDVPMKITITDNSGGTYEGTFCLKVENITGALEYCAYYASDNQNNDGLISAGETAYIDIALHNKSTSLIKDVNVTLSCASSAVTLKDNALTLTEKFGNIAPNKYHSSYSYQTVVSYIETDTLEALGYCSGYNAPFSFTVKSGTAEGTQLPFTLLITDWLGNRYRESFTITVHEFSTKLTIEGFKYENLMTEDPTCLEPGSNIGLDICVGNGIARDKGTTSRVSGIKVTLKKTEHITLNGGVSEITKTYRAINVGCYKTFGENNKDSSSVGKASKDALTYLTSSANAPFVISIASDYHKGNLVIPIEITDGNEHKWSDNLTLLVK